MKQTIYSGIIAVLMVAAGCAGTERAAQNQDVPPADGEWITLLNGADLSGWEMAGPGSFTLQPDGSLLGHGGMGLFYYGERPFRDYVLELEWKAATDSANSGIFVRFPEKTEDPWYAVNNGYEIQIDDSRDPLHATGSVYTFSAPFKKASRPAGEWNKYRIEVDGQRYRVYLNGELVNDFIGDRGREGYIGIQNHDDESRVWYRNIRVKPLAGGGPESLGELFRVEEERAPIRVLMVTATHGFRHGEAIEKAKEVLSELEETTEFEFDFTEDVADLNAQNLAQYDLLFFNNATLRLQRQPQAAEGIWGTYNIALETPNNTMTGQLVLTGTADDPAGTILFDNVGMPQPTPLRDVQVDGSDVTFSFQAGEYGTIRGETTLDGDALEGTLAVQGNRLELAGTRADGSGAPTNGAPAEILVTEAQRQAVLDFVRSGKGFVGTHAALDAFYDWPAYREMVGGGLFEEHPWTQPVCITIEDKDNPATAHLGDEFCLRDEIYVLDENPRWNSHVLASLDLSSVGIEQGPADITRNDYPISWIREYEGGKVFITKLGHFADVWATPDYLQHVLQGMRMAAGRIPADFSGHRVKETIAEGVWPDDIAVDEQGDVWIAELRGKVHHYDAATGETRVIAQINTTDPTKIEHGLYGIEVDPNFYGGEPYVYLFYAEPETFINTLSRYEYRNGQIDLSTEKVLLRVPTEPNCCHQAGDLEWGPDGTLYISTGDTGMSETRPSWELTEEEIQAFMDRNNLKDYHWSRLVDSERTAQNLQDLRGKILRINKDGTIPKDNPFYGVPGVRWEVYAYGLRNPYRFKVDPETGAVHIGVVGPDEVVTYDEYNVALEGGENFGWPRDNGRLFYNEWTADMTPNWTPPTWEYTYETGGRSATVGPIYRHEGPGAFPAIFQDKLFIFDWARGWIKWADVETLPFTNDSTASVKAWDYRLDVPAQRYTNIRTFDVLTEGTRPISMEIGPDGSIYLAEFDGFWGPDSSDWDAKVTRYRWVSNNEKPIGAVLGAPEDGSTEVRFDGTRSFDPDGGRLTFHWDFGDGAVSTDPRPVHTYAQPGTYTVRLTVADPQGTRSEPAHLEVEVGTAMARAERE